MTQHDQATRALDAPFMLPNNWEPIPGTCTRCGGQAWLGETKWWHNAEPCQSRGRTADFLPD